MDHRDNAGRRWWVNGQRNLPSIRAAGNLAVLQLNSRADRETALDPILWWVGNIQFRWDADVP